MHCKSRIRYIIILALAIILVATRDLMAQTQQVDLSNHSSRQLLKMAENSLHTDSLPMQAIQSLNIVIQRYHNAPEDKEACKYAASAMRNLGNIYMTYVIDYSKAYKHLSMAKQIAQESNNEAELANIYLSLAALYNVNTTAENKEHLMPLTIQSLNDAMNLVLLSGDEELMPYIVDNMLLSSFFDVSMKDAYRDALNKFKTSKFKKTTPRLRLSRLLLDGVEAYWKGDIEKAVRIIKQTYDIKIEATYNERTRYTIDLILIHIYENTGYYEDAIALARKGIEFAHDKALKDYERTMAGILANLYEQTGQKDSLDKYYNEYLRMRISQEEVNGLHSVETLNFLSEIERTNAQVEQLSLQKQRDRIQRNIILCGVAILVCLLICLLWVHVMLRRNHKRLFMESQRNLKWHQQYELLRRNWDKELQVLRNENERLRTEADIMPADTQTDTPADSKLDEEDEAVLTDIYSRILSHMDSSQQIYNPGYSLATLARDLGISVKSASRAINVRHGCNFHAFLNEYRIRRACHIMCLTENRNYTVEYFAESVGFKSRTSFSTLFKKLVGLTPAEYIRLAAENGKEDD